MRSGSPAARASDRSQFLLAPRFQSSATGDLRARRAFDRARAAASGRVSRPTPWRSRSTPGLRVFNTVRTESHFASSINPGIGFSFSRTSSASFFVEAAAFALVDASPTNATGAPSTCRRSTCRRVSAGARLRADATSAASINFIIVELRQMDSTLCGKPSRNRPPASGLESRRRVAGHRRAPRLSLASPAEGRPPRGSSRLLPSPRA